MLWCRLREAGCSPSHRHGTHGAVPGPRLEWESSM